MTKQTKEQFLKNVEQHANMRESRKKDLEEIKDESLDSPVYLDKELHAVWLDVRRYQQLMIESALYLSEMCAKKLKKDNQ